MNFHEFSPFTSASESSQKVRFVKPNLYHKAMLLAHPAKYYQLDGSSNSSHCSQFWLLHGDGRASGKRSSTHYLTIIQCSSETFMRLCIRLSKISEIIPARDPTQCGGVRG